MLKLLSLISSCITYLKFIGAASLLCFLLKGACHLFTGGHFLLLHFMEHGFCLKVSYTKFIEKFDVVMLQWIS